MKIKAIVFGILTLGISVLWGLLQQARRENAEDKADRAEADQQAQARVNEAMAEAQKEHQEAVNEALHGDIDSDHFTHQ